jgi:hypothetical protein
MDSAFVSKLSEQEISDRLEEIERFNQGVSQDLIQLEQKTHDTVALRARLAMDVGALNENAWDVAVDVSGFGTFCLRTPFARHKTLARLLFFSANKLADAVFWERSRNFFVDLGNRVKLGVNGEEILIMSDADEVDRQADRQAFYQANREARARLVQFVKDNELQVINAEYIIDDLVDVSTSLAELRDDLKQMIATEVIYPKEGE